MIELGQILTGLVRRTEEGKLRWSPSAENDRFIASVDAISILIIEEMNFRGNTCYRLDIFDESGEVIESLGYQDTTESEDRELERLFVLARRSANNIDLTLERLARALGL